MLIERRTIRWGTPVASLALCWMSMAAGDTVHEQAQRVLDASGIKGGLVVHLGCGDGRLTAALRVSDRFLVHGLDTDAASVGKARINIQKMGLYGAVSADTFDGEHLPYADNLVNLIVVSGGEGRVSREEILRVLCPGGVALAPPPLVPRSSPPAVAGGDRRVDALPARAGQQRGGS